MFKLISIELFNFRSYAGAQTFEFPTQSGLYSLTGKNLVNPRLGSNGAGKSTLLEAIYWVIYGRTSRGLKASAIITRGKSTAYVKLTCMIGDQTSVITRRQSPNALELDGVPVDQEAVQKFVRLTADAFTHSIMFTQFGDAFFDLAPSAKLSLFSGILELDYWLERSNAALALSTELATEQQILERNLASLTGQITVIEADLVDLHKLNTAFEDEQQTKLASLKAELTAMQIEHGGYAKSLGTAQQAHEGAKARIKKYEHMLERRESRIIELNGQLQKALGAASTAKASLNAIRAALAALQGLKGTCPTCQQKVTSGHLKAEAAKLATREADANRNLETLEEQLGIIDAEITEQQRGRHGETRSLTTIRGNCTDFGEEVHRCQRRLESVGERMDVLSRTLKRGPEANSFEGHISAKEHTRGTLLSQRARVSSELQQVTQDKEAVTYWVKGFKQIRLTVIDRTLAQLELEVNNNLAALGLIDWRVVFDVERENKSGGVTKGFTVLIYAPGMTEPVPFEAWSGGETQRLRLAGDLGLASLITNRAGITSTIEFYDEPSRHLSEEGLLDLTEALHDRALAENKVIILVDHHTLSFGQFLGQITASRDINGTRLSIVE